MNKKITDEEIKLFRDAMADVKPFKKSAKKEVFFENPQKEKDFDQLKKMIVEKSIRTIKKTPRQKIKIREEFSDTTFFTIDEKQPDISGTDIISFNRAGLQRKRFSDLSRGKMHPQATLDLHDHTSDEAITAVERFLTHAQKKGLRTVCIIHGKGLYSSGNKPVLKNLLNSFLRQHPMVLAFHSEKNNPGAMIVLLKSRL